MWTICHGTTAKYENTAFLDYRNLTSFHISDLPHPVPEIVYLSLRGNKLDRFSIGIKEFPNLERLILSENSEMTFPPDGSPFLASTSLIDLDCECCAIKAIYTGSLSRFPLLETLRLANNTIQMIEKRAFQRNPNIRMLDLRHNKLTTLPTTMLIGLRKMKTLDVSGNRELAPQDGQPFLVSNSLQILKCDNCGFRTVQFVTFSKLSNLKKLHLQANSLLVGPCFLPSVNIVGMQWMQMITDYQRYFKQYSPTLKRKFSRTDN